jgi:hypothetical protein
MHRLGRNGEARQAFLHAVEFQFQAPQAMSAVARSYAHENDGVKTVEWLEKSAAAGFSGVQFVNGDPDFAKVKSAAGFAEAVAKIDRNAHPCLARPESRQLDFWLGEWDVHVNGQSVASSKIESVLDGCIVQENWMPPGTMGGKSWNFYNAATRKWEQVWVGSGGVVKFEGEFKDGAMRFEGLTPQSGRQCDDRALDVYARGAGQGPPGLAALHRRGQDLDHGVRWHLHSEEEIIVMIRVWTIAILSAAAADAQACSTRPEVHQFDFWVGEWDVEVGGRIVARSRIERIAGTCIIQENWMPFGGGQGKSWNFYNQASGQWEQVWVTGTGGVLEVAGGWKDGAMRERGARKNADGTVTIHRRSFTPLEKGRVRQLCEESGDNGATWHVVFDGLYLPAGRPKGHSSSG